MMSTVPYDTDLLQKAAKKHRLKFVILHGSFATGQERQGSDLDIAVLGERPLSFEEEMKLRAEMADIFGDRPERELDIKTLHRVDPLFRYEVTRDGVLLYGDATAYEEFKAYGFRAFEDAKPLFELERTLSRKYQKHLNALAVGYA